MISNFRVLSEELRIIQSTRFKKKVSLERPLSPRKTNCLLDLPVLLGHWSQWFCRELCRPVHYCFRNDDIQEFLLKVGRNFIVYNEDPRMMTLKGLYKFRIRESEKHKTVLELYDLEIHQKKSGLDYHILENIVKRRQDIRNQNFSARNGNYEKNAVVENQGTKQHVQRILGNCWQWETNGQCVKGDNCSCSEDFNKRAKLTQPNSAPRFSSQQIVRNWSRTRSPTGKSPSAWMVRWFCKDYFKEFCTNSLCEKWHLPEFLW